MSASPSLSRFCHLGPAVAVLGALSGAVGCSTPHARTASPRAAQTPAEQRQRVVQIIEEMLTDVDRGAPQSDPTQEAGSAPPVDMPEAFARQEKDEKNALDAFTRDVVRIQETVPRWNNGTGVALKFLRETTGSRFSLVYVDPTPPEFKRKPALWMIQASSRNSEETLSHFVLLLKKLEPGRYEGSASNKDVVMSTAMGESWDGKAPSTTWSINNKSWCELILRETSTPGMLEGDFRAKLMDNAGTRSHTIESGYMYIKL